MPQLLPFARVCVASAALRLLVLRRWRRGTLSPRATALWLVSPFPVATLTLALAFSPFSLGFVVAFVLLSLVGSANVYRRTIGPLRARDKAALGKIIGSVEGPSWLHWPPNQTR